MKQLLIKGGHVEVADVPAPRPSKKAILVRTAYSCVSPGTELAGLRASAEPLYRRALRQPGKILTVVQMAREQGIEATLKRVKGSLSFGIPIGYSAVGTVVEVGSEVIYFVPGDVVACAGAGVANHAEIIDVPVNLAVKVPDGLDLVTASSVTLGAIALQGVRRAAPTLGETFVVIGLGVLGQLVVQLLRNAGVTVVGVDPDEARVELALRHGMDFAVAGNESYVDFVSRISDGFGADAAVITAAGKSDDIINEAMKACRRKGRVVPLGDVGMRLERAELYRKELDLLISTSYGPGRYDPVYEDEGQDYPLPYVRWTENRNMEAYLRLLAKGTVSLEGFHEGPVDVDLAPAAYERLANGDRRPLLTFVSYPSRPDARSSTISLRSPTAASGRIRVAMVGAGAFAKAVHLPNLSRLKEHYEIRAVMSRTGSSATSTATTCGAAYATTDYEAILDDREIDLVVISTRHHLHGSMVLEALRAGKAVFVEKPLGIYPSELDAIESFFSSTRDAPPLLTGFNRRFSPALREIAALLAGRSTPLVVNYRMNAGFMPPEHWVHGEEGGGRNIGEACHIYDVFNFLTQSPWTRVDAAAVVPRSRQWRCNDNFVATVCYADGSIGTLTYTSQGAPGYPKERMEIFVDGKVLSLDDYRSVLLVSGGREAQRWSSTKPEKGHLEELQALAAALKGGGPCPISIEHQIAATRISFLVEASISPGPRKMEEARGQD